MNNDSIENLINLVQNISLDVSNTGSCTNKYIDENCVNNLNTSENLEENLENLNSSENNKYINENCVNNLNTSENLYRISSNQFTEVNTEIDTNTNTVNIFENMAELSLSIDPLKYLNKLPEFFGDYRDLQNFIDLVDKVHPLLLRYDALSQSIFSDIIKSKLKNKAREVIEINNHVTTWLGIKEILINNFGERSSLEELFDQLRGTTFKTNSVDFYNEIKSTLRRLNVKTKLSSGDDAELITHAINNNKNSALTIFKSKIPEPMRSILYCRNPGSLEDAIGILHEAGYAYYNVNTPRTANHNLHQRNNKNNPNRNSMNRNFDNRRNYNNNSSNTNSSFNNNHQNTFSRNYNGNNQNQRWQRSNFTQGSQTRPPFHNNQAVNQHRFQNVPDNSFGNNSFRNFPSNPPQNNPFNNPQHNRNPLPPPEPMDIGIAEAIQPEPPQNCQLQPQPPITLYHSRK